MKRFDIDGHAGAAKSVTAMRALAWQAALGFLVAGPAFGDDMERAKTIATTVCQACHGADGNSVAPNFPKLAGNHAEYLTRQLSEFIAGRRPSDIMVPIVTTLDPVDFNALGEYFGAQKPSPGVPGDPAAMERGKKLYADGDEDRALPACSGCHKDDASGNKRFPRLAGQYREYLIAEMTKFKDGSRNTSGGRVMREVAKRMSDDEIAVVAEYLAGL